MKLIVCIAALVLLTCMLFQISCRKEHFCEYCRGANKPPIANAGNDTSIILPVDSIMLDGSKSSDPDDGIATYEWAKIAGPDTFQIVNSSAASTIVNKLVQAVYSFELTVTDKGGLSDKDTMLVTVYPAGTINRPPVAKAGNDTILILPANSMMLDGGKSSDPDNNITGYKWSKISGPAAFNIASANAVQAQLTNLIEGTYQFELKVTDAGALFSKDTIQITVNIPPPSQALCEPVNRPAINAQLIPAGTLSAGRVGIVVASAGNKILFAGGANSSNTCSATVDIYNITTQTWSAAKLSMPRTGIAAVASANKIYFAGGRTDNFTITSRVDIYDVNSNIWSTAELSQPREALTPAAVGDKIMFTGGNSIDSLGNFTTSTLVDIYNTTTGTWTTATLSMARTGMTATTAGSKVYFAGGFLFWDQVYDRIDIYDNSTNTWSTSTMTERKVEHGAIAVGDYIYWAGGSPINNFNDHDYSCTVEKRNLNNGTSTIAHLSQPLSISHALLKNNRIVFYSGNNDFDIYDPGNDTWYIGKMNRGFIYAAVICVNNVIYIAGGGDYSSSVSSQVYTLEF